MHRIMITAYAISLDKLKKTPGEFLVLTWFDPGH